MVSAYPQGSTPMDKVGGPRADRMWPTCRLTPCRGAAGPRQCRRSRGRPRAEPRPPSRRPPLAHPPPAWLTLHYTLSLRPQLQADLKRRAAQLDAAENQNLQLKGEVERLKAANAELQTVGGGGRAPLPCAAASHALGAGRPGHRASRMPCGSLAPAPAERWRSDAACLRRLCSGSARSVSRRLLGAGWPPAYVAGLVPCRRAGSLRHAPPPHPHHAPAPPQAVRKEKGAAGELSAQLGRAQALLKQRDLSVSQLSAQVEAAQARSSRPGSLSGGPSAASVNGQAGDKERRIAELEAQLAEAQGRISQLTPRPQRCAGRRAAGVLRCALVARGLLWLFLFPLTLRSQWNGIKSACVPAPRRPAPPPAAGARARTAACRWWDRAPAPPPSTPTACAACAPSASRGRTGARA